MLYVIGSEDPPFKIGVSSNPRKRLQTLQTANPVPIDIVLSAKTNDDYAAEKRLHAKLGKYRIINEWFDCDLRTISTALSDIGIEFQFSQKREQPRNMKSATFQQWLAEMEKPPFFANDRKCARLLGVPTNSIVNMKRNGTDQRTALACRALLHRLEPYE